MSIAKTVYVYREEEINIGQDAVIESLFDNYEYGVVFEDDGTTGYFYAVGKDMRVLDALHIYNVENVVDKQIPSIVKILWNEDLSQSFLSINGYYHAVFDFKNRAGYCRSGFPETRRKWIKVKSRILTDDLLANM